MLKGGKERKKISPREGVHFLRVHSKDAVINLRRLGSNKVWITENKKDLRKKYGDKYIAVADRKVIAHNKDFDKLLSDVKEKYPENIDHIAIDFVPKKKLQLIL